MRAAGKASPSRRHSPTADFMPVLFALLLILAGCGGEPSASTVAPSPTALPAADASGVTVETGGMALPSAAGDAAAPAAEPLTPTATEAPVLAPGTVVTATAPATLYAAPDLTAPRFAEYPAGSRLALVEPDGDYTAYPVEVEGQRWYRVRADDGLVGWMMGEAVAAE